MTYTRVTAVWSGAAGLPGYSRFKFDGNLDGTQTLVVVGKVKTFFQTIASYLPAAVTVSFLPVAGVYTTDDELIAEVTHAGASPVTGGGTGLFAAPSGACVNWATAAVLAGRKLRGRTFIVPLAGLAYQSDGTLLDAARTTINDAATSLKGGVNGLIINGTHATAGSLQSPVTAAAVSDRVAVLRSRRG